ERRHRPRHDKSVAVRRARWRRSRVRARAVGDSRANEIGEALDNVDAHGAFAAEAEAGDAIGFPRDGDVGDERGAPRGGELRYLVDARAGSAALAERPELGREHPDGWLHESGNIDVIGAEAHAELAQQAARILVQAFHVL